ncbi:cupin domain-containing protein [Microscilla marina]|uniref:Cupin domain protein n=1 Tax=Microscilla marina ATCC 23134 TaxID=313606 RepID=A1ZPE8_MICM2|nr:cupin domain-containing protein [Microscilla marina]EAY27687.1 cupin domain protein [Microscilla marina ATCC 23134]
MKLKLLLFTTLCFAQLGYSQNLVQLAKLKPAGAYENVKVQKIYSNKHTSSFVIWIKKGVKAHKHLKHTEQVYILAGKARMRLDDQTFEVKKGDWIAIPEGSVHAVTVTSRKPLQVFSVQSPEFLGKDRVFVKE